MNERHYLGSCKVCGEGNSIIFINRENPSRTRGRAYMFHIFLTITMNSNEDVLLIMVICVILLFILICFNFWNNTKAGIWALIPINLASYLKKISVFFPNSWLRIYTLLRIHVSMFQIKCTINRTFTNVKLGKLQNITYMCL